jgi:phage tail-like protein
MSAAQPYFLLREPDELAQRSSRLTWDARRRGLTLAQNQALRLPSSDPTAALAAWASAEPLVFDRYGQVCRISPDGSQLEYNAGRGYLPLADGELQPVTAVAGRFTDLHLGIGGRLAAGYSDTDVHGVLVFDLVRRWQVATELPEAPLRVCIDKDNRIWCLTQHWLVQCAGEPLPHGYLPRGERFEPVSVNPSPLRVLTQSALAAQDQPLALCADEEQLYLLVHHGDGTQTLVARPLTAPDTRRYPLPEEVPFGVDLGVLGDGRLALLAPQNDDDPDFVRRDCPVLTLRWDPEENTGAAMLVRERYPMLSQAVPRFVTSGDGVLRYQAAVEPGGQAEAQGMTVHPRDLQPLRRPRYFSAGVATLTQVLDSGEPDTVWHRLYLEGCIPPGCRITVHAKAYNAPAQRTSTPFFQQPAWVWSSQRSNRPFGKGVGEAKPGERGLFELLFQRDKGPVRRLTGRYLLLRIQMESDGRQAPVIHALKAYYPRRSYQEHFLPEHFHQEQAVDPALDPLPANGADVRERLLAAFEAEWTPLEERIASSEILLSPDYTPSEHLPWLAEAMGQQVPGHWPESRRRRWLKCTGELQRWRGTLTGLQLALDIVTDGALARGQVVLVENFRLRRTMATLLGMNMDDSDHPLTLGTGMSGNSLVGASLILAEEGAREFLALFSPDLAQGDDAQAVAEFFDRYANQVTVLLHGPARKMKDAVTATLEEQMPSHVQWRLVETDHPFVLGLSPLLGIDTYLELQPEPRPVELDNTYLGREGLLRNPAALSPRDVNARVEH